MQSLRGASGRIVNARVDLWKNEAYLVVSYGIDEAAKRMEMYLHQVSTMKNYKCSRAQYDS